MLQAIREKMSGWVLVIIVLLLAIPFALFGINNYFQAQVDSYVAKVNDVEIAPRELQERLDLQRRQYRQMLGQDADLRFLESPDAKRRVLDALIDEELRFQDARSSGVEVPKAKLQSEILGIDAFKPGGTFDQTAYVNTLRSNNMTPAMFEQRLIRDLASREITMRLGESAFVTDGEIDSYLRLQNQTRTFSALTLNSAEETVADPTEESIAAEFEARKSEYQTPELVTLEYVELQPADMKVEPPTEDDLKGRYEEQKDRYVVPEQRQISHILFEVANSADAEAQKAALTKAEAVAAEIRAGKDFSEAATDNSDDLGSKQQGGDLGWLEPGSSDPAFEEAAFKLEVGSVSDPVLGSNGYHLILVREIKPESRREFAEVRAELETEYQTSEQSRLYSDLAGQLVDEIHRDPQSLQAPAEHLSLEIKRSEPFSRAGGAGIAGNPKVLEEAFSELVLERGQTSELIDLGKDHVVAIRVVERKAPEPKTLEMVRGEIESKLRLKAQREQLASKVAALEARMLAGESVAAIATELGKTAEEADAVVRTAGNQNPTLLEQVFKLPRPGADPLRKAIELNDDQRALVELTAVVDADPATVEQAARDSARSQLVAQWTEAESKAYVDALRKSAVIKIAEDRM